MAWTIHCMIDMLNDGDLDPQTNTGDTHRRENRGKCNGCDKAQKK